MRTLSTTFLRELGKQETAEVALFLVELSHASFDAPFRYVRNFEGVTSNGATYEARAMDVTLPDEEAERVPTVRLRIDNVDRGLLFALRALDGIVSVTLRLVLASQPDVIEVEVAGMEGRAMDYNDATLSLDLGVEPILDAAFGVRTLSPSNAPGLF